MVDNRSLPPSGALVPQHYLIPTVQKRYENVMKRSVDEDQTIRTVPSMVRRVSYDNESPESESEYFYLKTRDYVSVLRRTLGFSRFHRHRAKDHSVWEKNKGPLHRYAKKCAHLSMLVHLGMGLPENEDFFIPADVMAQLDK